MVSGKNLSVVLLFVAIFSGCRTREEAPNNFDRKSHTLLDDDTTTEPAPEPVPGGCCYIRKNSTDIICKDSTLSKKTCNQKEMEKGSCKGKFQAGYAVEWTDKDCSTFGNTVPKSTVEEPGVP